MNKGNLVTLSLVTMLALSACGGGGSTTPTTTVVTTAPVVDVLIECTFTQVNDVLSDDSATINTQCEDTDGIKTAEILVNGELITLSIPEGTTSFDINTTINNLPADSNTTAELEVTSVNGQTGEIENVPTYTTGIITNETPIVAPSFTQEVYDTGVEVLDNTNDAQVILDLKSVITGDDVVFSIDSIKVAHENERYIWEDSIKIENGVLVATNLSNWDPDAVADGFTVTILATNKAGEDKTDIKYIFQNTK